MTITDPADTRVARRKPDAPAQPTDRPTLWSRVARAAGSLIPLAYFKKPPTIIIIDATNSCNLRCPVCPVTYGLTRKAGMMPLDTLRAIIDDLAVLKRKPAIYFSFSGEPTLNRALPDMVAYATEHGHETYLSTNATKLDAEMCERLIQAGLGRVNLCMDGFSKEAQEAYRVRSDFDAVKANIELFAETRARLGASNPVCVLQTLLTAYSEPQMDAITDWARDIGLDRVRFKTFSLGSVSTPEQKESFGHFLPKDRALLRHTDAPPRSQCTIPLFQSVVYWNGNLGLCCIDYDGVVDMPNVKGAGFLAAWRSDKAARARKAGFLKQHGICEGCSLSNAESTGFRVDL